MKNSEFVKVVLDRYRWLVFFGVAAFLFASVYYFRFAKKYTAEVTVMIPAPAGNGNTQGATDAERYAFATQNTMTVSRLSNFIYSDIMVKHLDEKFDLLYHYQIDKSNPYSWNMLMDNVQKSIKVERVTDEMVKIFFSDINEVVAADAANEVASQLIVMNKDYVLSTIKQRKDLYASVIGELNLQVGDQLKQLQTVLEGFRANNNLSEQNFSKIDNNFNNALTDISQLTNDLVRTQQYYKWSQIAIENNFQNNIFIVNSAYPNKPPLSFVRMFLVGLAASVLAICTFCTVVYLYFYLRNRINTMLNEI